MRLIKEFDNEEKRYIDVICKKCGWKNHLYWGDKRICRNCGYYIFKDDKSEFIYRLKEKLR